MSSNLQAFWIKLTPAERSALLGVFVTFRVINSLGLKCSDEVAYRHRFENLLLNVGQVGDDVNELGTDYVSELEQCLRLNPSATPLDLMLGIKNESRRKNPF